MPLTPLSETRSEVSSFSMFFVVAERYAVTLVGRGSVDKYLSRTKKRGRFAALRSKNGPGEKLTPNAIFSMEVGTRLGNGIPYRPSDHSYISAHADLNQSAMKALCGAMNVVDGAHRPMDKIHQILIAMQKNHALLSPQFGCPRDLIGGLSEHGSCKTVAVPGWQGEPQAL